MNKKVQKRALTLLLILALLAALLPGVVAAEQTLVDADSVWYYLDNGTDPAAGDADRTVWTQPDYALTSAWKQAAGPFGSKRGAAQVQSGYTAKTVLAGCNGSSNVPAYFFRTTFRVENLAGMDHLRCTLVHDDAAIVYINGVRVAVYEDIKNSADGTALNTPIDSNLCYGGEAVGEPRTSTFFLEDLSCLRSGENVIAVELHQLSGVSSDVWFAMPELALADEPRDLAISDIILNPGTDETAMNFTWYFPENIPGTVYLCPEAELVDGAMPEHAAAFTSSTAITNEGLYTNQTTATGLLPDTVYAYCLESGDQLTGVRTFRTAPAGDFSFAFTGDPQIGSGGAAADAQLWDRTLTLITSDPQLSNARFLITAGDQVNRCYDESHYDAFLQSPLMRTFPVAVSIGNHDNTTFGEADESLAVSFQQHYNLPNVTGLGDSTAGSDYWFTCNDVLFLMINGNSLDFAEHRQFMEQAAAANPDAQWRIVVMHQSMYSIANHSSDSDVLQRREQLSPIFQELGVDLVLMGHDHTYCRTYLMDGTTPITDPAAYDDATMTSATDAQGVLYITGNSACGNRNYNIKNKNFPYAAVKNQEYVANVTRVDVTDRSLTITTYRANDMTVVDAFTLRKSRPGADLAEKIAAMDASSAAQLEQLQAEYETLNPDQQAQVYNYSLLQAAISQKKATLTRQVVDCVAEAAGQAATAALYAQQAKAAAGIHEAALPFALEAQAQAAAADQAAGETAGFALELEGATLTRMESLAQAAALAQAQATEAAKAAKNAAASAQKAADTAQKAAAVDQLIADLAPVTLESGQAIRAAREAYDGLTEAEKTFVKRHEDLVAAEAAYEALRQLAAEPPFEDLDRSAYYYEPVLWAVREGITSGITEKLFGPGQTCTRAQVVTFLWRAEGSPEPVGKENPFRDVSADSYCYKAVLWAVEQEITKGVDTNSFAPDAPCTRGQVVTFLHRALGMPEPQGQCPFVDVPAGSFYRDAVVWAVGEGVTDGTTERTFSPLDPCTRGQIVTFLFRALC